LQGDPKKSPLGFPSRRSPNGSAARARVAIVDALKRCMVAQGYADTSLSDLARTAGISVSHFLYYYPSKDAVLIDLLFGVCWTRPALRSMPTLTSRPPGAK